MRRIAAVTALIIFTAATYSFAFARDGGFFAPRGRPTEDAVLTWLDGNWVGRCFPDFASELRPVGERRTLQSLGIPYDNPTGSFNVGAWNDIATILPSFLTNSIITVRRADGGRYTQLFAIAYDANQRTAVFQHVGDGERFGGFIGNLDPAPAGMPVIDSTTATNANAAGVTLSVSASPARPAFNELVRALGYPREVKQACGYREVRFENPDPHDTIDSPLLTAYQFASAIVDERGLVRAFGTGIVIR